MNYDSKCLCMILHGKQGERLGAKTWLIIGEHGQVLRYESFCLITNGLLSVVFWFMGSSGSFHTFNQSDMHANRTLVSFMAKTSPLVISLQDD